MSMDASRERQWADGWTSAGAALAELRRRELRAMTEDQALTAAENLLSLAALSELNPSRRAASGLVRQQALFHRRHSD